MSIFVVPMRPYSEHFISTERYRVLESGIVTIKRQMCSFSSGFFFGSCLTFRSKICHWFKRCEPCYLAVQAFGLNVPLLAVINKKWNTWFLCTGNHAHKYVEWKKRQSDRGSEKEREKEAASLTIICALQSCILFQ